MSQVKISGNASGTGIFTIASPSGNTDRTLTLPDATGTFNVSGAATEVPSGSASTPSIYPTGDTNTGIFFPAADTIAFTEGGVESARIDSSGNFLVGTTNSNPISNRSNGTVTAAGGGFNIRTATSGTAFGLSVSSGTHIQFYTDNGSAAVSAGSISSNGSTTSFNNSSDYRLKEDIVPMTGALARVAALNPVTYKWKVDGSAGEGFIAHELQAVCPYAVTGEKDAVDEDGNIKPQGIDTSFLVATLTAAIQELKAELDSVKATLKGAA
jgi:hypothetical protein